MVRAKFKFTSYNTSLQGDKELRTLNFNPVYGNGDPNHENTKFFAYTPSGTVQLGTVSPEAWSQFELGKEYYLDFTVAE